MIRRFDGGLIYDAATGKVREASLAVNTETGKIVAIGDAQHIQADEVEMLHGEWILPGFIDMHVHLRDPGLTHKESLQTGLQAAAAGGFTQVACMPNTKPAVDTDEIVRDIVRRGDMVAKASVHPIACITVNQQGGELTDFERLKQAGAVGLSDDGKGVQDGGRMMEAMARSVEVGLPIIIHSEDESLSRDGVLHPNAAHRLQLKGIPVEAESAMVARDVLLAERTGAHLHVCHVSTEQSVAIIRFAKQRGVRVTAEVTPHHLLLSEAMIDRDDAVFKVNPPLQSERDRMACLAGFIDGTLDIIATDHAPHSADEKAQSISTAPFGMVGFETAFALLYTYLVLPGLVSLKRLTDGMSADPARIFHLEGGRLSAGAPADFTVVDVTNERVIDVNQFYTKGRNTPFANWHATGFPVQTVRQGHTIFRAMEERVE